MPTEVGTAVNFDMGPALAGLDKLAAADLNLRTEQLKTNAAISQSFTTVAQSVQQYESQLGAILMDTRAATVAQQQFSRDIGGLVKEIRDQAAAQRELQRASAESAAERRKASAAAREAAKAEKQAAKEVAEAEKQAAAAARLAAKEAAAAAKEAERSGGAASGLGKVFGGLQGQIVAAFSVATVKAFVSNVIEAGQAAEATLSKLTFANGGNTQAAARDLAFIRAEADRLGLEINSAGKSYGSFTAAAAAANFPLAEARKLFLATAGASATLKLSADDTQGVLLALTQVLSKGTVQAEELRGQIGERLPGAFAIAARSMGVTEQQLNKLLQTGQVKAADFLPKFAEELQKTFGDGTAQAADSFTANLARIENEFSAFFLRFQGVASSGTAKIANIFRRFNEGLDLKSLDGRERLGEQAAQPGIKAYEAQLASLVQQAEAQAKAAGTDTAFQVGFVLAAQRNAIEAQRAEAEKALAFFDTTTKQGNLNAGNFQGGLQAFRQAEVQARARIKLLDGEIAKLDELATARKKADDPKDLEGLIKKQEDLIKALKARQQAATQENQGNGTDFLFGKGGLNEQLKAAQVELDRLLGKVDKTAKAAADKLAAALRALAAAQADLQTKAAAAVTKDADDAALRARLAFEEQLRQVGIVKQKLIERERAVRAAGGRGSRADGVIDGAQDQQLAQLRVAALDRYYEELGKIERAREQRLFDLRVQDNQKEIDTINRAYDAKLAAQRLGQSEEYDLLDEAAGLAVDRQRKRSQEELAIEEARQRDLLALRAQQEQKRIDQEKQLATGRAALVGVSGGVGGNGLSTYQARLEEIRQTLEAEKKAAQDSLNNTLSKQGKEAEAERLAYSAQIKRYEAQLADLKRVGNKFDFSLAKLLLGKDDDGPDGAKRQEVQRQIDATVGAVVNALNEINAAEQQAAQQRAQNATQRINELGAQLGAEIELNRAGSASNIAGLQAEIQQQRQIRGEAIQEQKKAAREKVLIDTISQASAVATSVAQIIQGFSLIPIIGPALGLAASALVVGAFITSKAQAYSAASQNGAGFFTGGYTGGESVREERGVVHGREFVFDNEKTAMYRNSLFEPLHAGRLPDWGAPELSALLPDLELPGRMREERANFVLQQQATNLAPLLAKYDALHDRLSGIEASNDRMANRTDKVPLGENRYAELSDNGGMKVVKVG